MAAQRPNVIVYQEYDNLNVAPDIPDLNVLIVGTCNQVLDYLDDKEDCYADDYGALDANNPFTDPTAIVISSPPNAEPGAELDADSVRVLFDAARVVLVEDGDTASEYGAYTSGDNLFQAHDDDGGVDFVAEEIAAGDILIVQGSGTSDHVKTVKGVVVTFEDIAGTANFRTNGVQPGDVLTISNDVPPGGSSRNGTYEIVSVRSEKIVELSGVSWTQNPVNTFGGGNVCDFVIQTATGAVRMTETGRQMANYTDLYTTTDFSENNPANPRWRVERNVNDIELDATDFTISGNQITVLAAITTDLSTTLTGKKVSFARIYVEYAALRTDLQKLTTLSNYSEMEANLGKYDARNPLFVGSVIAKANTTTAIQVYGVKSNDLTGYLDFLDRISSEREIYAIVPLTYDTSILAAINQTNNNLADPNYALTNGVKQKFRVALGAVELQTTKDMVAAESGGGVQQVTGSSPGDTKQITLVNSGAPALDLVALGVLPGYTVRYTELAGPVHTWTVAHVNGTLVLETDEAVVAPPAAVDGDVFDILDTATGSVYSYTFAGGNSISITPGALDDLYLVWQVPGATFVSDGVIPGDILEIPDTLDTNTFSDGYGSWVIDEVLSEERVRVVNQGTNTSVLANELPHLYSREDASAVTGGTLYYRIIREMDKTQQVNEMVAVANSFASKRLVLCYPDSVDVAGLVDGSLPRTVATEPEVAAAQPGYYLACAVGGMTAGQPSQQGFTNVGIAGISRIYNSSDYFTEKQITDLSNGGVYVFIQQNPSALPTSVHEVTTDVSTLEFSEYMVTKNFDFIAWTFLDTLLPFLGTWNVIPETVEFIDSALRQTGDNLKARYVSKIGAPLTDYALQTVGVSDLSDDRIEAYLDVDLPMTLNTIGLHLVA